MHKEIIRETSINLKLALVRQDKEGITISKNKWLINKCIIIVD